LNIIFYSANVIVLFEIDLFEMKLFHAVFRKDNNNQESYVLGFIEEKFDISKLLDTKTERRQTCQKLKN
jgi:hypothetical protein